MLFGSKGLRLMVSIAGFGVTFSCQQRFNAILYDLLCYTMLPVVFFGWVLSGLTSVGSKGFSGLLPYRISSLC